MEANNSAKSRRDKYYHDSFFNMHNELLYQRCFHNVYRKGGKCSLNALFSRQSFSLCHLTIDLRDAAAAHRESHAATSNTLSLQTAMTQREHRQVRMRMRAAAGY
jgi:hypothetical protein